MTSKTTALTIGPLLATLLAALLLLSPAVWAEAEQAGKVAILRGEVKAVDAAGKERTLTARAAIHVNDTINTGPDSQVQLLFLDESIYTLGPDSSLKIDSFVYDPGKGTGELVADAAKGSFRMVTGAIAKKQPEQVKVRTPVATIGIRGTYFAGRITASGLQTLLVGGAIFVRNEGGSREINTPGFSTRVQSGGRAPEPPVRLSPAEARELLAPTEIGFLPQESGSDEGAAPGTGEPGTGEPGTGEPGTGEPGTGEPGMGEPGTGEPGMGEPGMGEPGTGEPGAPAPAPAPGTEPATAPVPMPEPMLADPMLVDPMLVDPMLADPMLADPMLADPMLADPMLDTKTFVDPVNSGIQQEIYNSVADSPAATAYGLTGKYIASDGILAWDGGIHGSSTGNQRELFLGRNGYAEGRLLLSGPSYDPTLDPTAPTAAYAFPSANLWGLPFDGGFIVYDRTGSFGYGFAETNALFGFAGQPIGTTALPTSGIGVYFGSGGFFSPDKQDLEGAILYINWGTNKVVGFVGGYAEEQVFYQGTLDRANKAIQGQMLGKLEYDVGADTFVKGPPASFGMDFYGSALQGIGGLGYGESQDPFGNTSEYWMGLMALIGKSQAYELLRPPAETYRGFVAGVAVPRSGAGTANLALLTNASPSDVTLNLNRTSSTLTGSMVNITGLSLGGNTHNLGVTLNPGPGAVYIDDHAMITTEVTTSGSVSGLGGITPVNTAVNFLSTDPLLWEQDPSQGIISYGHLSWGYWGVEYKAATTQFDVIPGSYWVAGELTQDVDIPAAAAGTAVYNGYAMGQAYDKTPGMERLYPIQGTSNLTANFSTHTLTGTLHLSEQTAAPERMEWTVNVNGNWGGSNAIGGGTAATIQRYVNGVPQGGAINAGGNLNAAFFNTNAGPAGAVAGNWKVDQVGVNHTAAGIFMGKK